VDASRFNYSLKRKCFSQNKNFAFITPSDWLHGKFKESILRRSQCTTINNGIDIGVFRPREKTKMAQLDSRRPVLLGVANIWEERKGLRYLVNLAKDLVGCQIIIIGRVTDKRQIWGSNIMHIPQTQNSIELAELYSSATVFVNPTLEDNFPTTNLESLACGTPVVTFATGGAPEMIDSSVGIVVEKGSYVGLLNAVNIILGLGKASFSSRCREKAESQFCAEIFLKRHVDLYKSYLHGE